MKSATPTIFFSPENLTKPKNLTKEQKRKYRIRRVVVFGALALILAAGLYFIYRPIPFVGNISTSKILGITVYNNGEKTFIDPSQFDADAMLAYLGTCTMHSDDKLISGIFYRAGSGPVIVIDLLAESKGKSGTLEQNFKYVQLVGSGAYNSYIYTDPVTSYYYINNSAEVFSTIQRMLKP